MSEDLSLLIKLLKMTTSSSDGEALVAMRKANEQVAKLKSDWESILRGKVTIIADPFVAAPVPPAPIHRAAPQPPPRPQPSRPYPPRTYRAPPSAFHPSPQPAPQSTVRVTPRSAKQRRKSPITINDLI